jgi:hypothetical protein
MSYQNSITALCLQILVLSTTYGSEMGQMPWESFEEKSISYAGKYFLTAKDHAKTLSLSDVASSHFQHEDNFYVTDIDISGCKGADGLLERIAQRVDLSSLQRINLSDSDVTLDGLNKLKALKPTKGVVRPFLQASARYGMQVIVIEVNVSGTDLARNKVWELNNKICVPNDDVINVTYLSDGDTDVAHLQILPRF